MRTPVLSRSEDPSVLMRPVRAARQPNDHHEYNSPRAGIIWIIIHQVGNPYEEFG